MIEIESYLPRLTQLFTQQGVELVYLFGSQATGRTGLLSDIDIAVLLGPEIPPNLWLDVQLDLITELAGIFQRDDIDVVILNQATPLLADRVIRFGRRLSESDPLIRLRFEVRTFHRYVDTAPLRRAQQQRMLEWTQERPESRQLSALVW